MNEQTASHAGRTVLITGASSGVGEAFAKALAAAGAHVIAAARRADKLQKLVDQIEREGGRASAIAIDVADENSVAKGFEEAEKQIGVVDTVIACAGMNINGSATELTVEDYDSIYRVNERGVFLTVREGGKQMLSAGEDVARRGRILVVGSLGSRHALQGLVAYSASKAAAAMLARGFAKEWARAGICVNALCPGYMLTDINADWFESDAGKRMVDRMPRKRLMPVEALNPLMLYLTSDAAAYTTGSVIQIDDGQMI